MLRVAQKLTDQSLFIRLDSVPNAADAVANDVQYHLKCWVLAQRTTNQLTPDKSEIQEMDDVNKVLADIEIINIVKSTVCDRKKVLNMNDINITYNNLLANPVEQHVNYKRYLKRLVTEKLSSVVLSMPKSRRQSEVVCSTSSQEEAMENYRNSPDDSNEMYETASLVRKDILEGRNWFKGGFDWYELPTSLKYLLKWIIIGPKVDVYLCPKKKESIDNVVKTIGEIIAKSVKTKKQVSYNNEKASFRDSIETPFSVDLGMCIHQQTRSKKVIDTLSSLNLSIPYDRVLEIETSIANAISPNAEKNGGIYIPPTICKGVPIHCAIDHTDFSNDTPDGKFEFHGTGHVVFQK